ncbi:MAG: anthranilate phosphoribosyltransferase, partial [Candidatus Nitrosopumilus limneticus]|nr:anthranilate phosphoribosyltransferase [Candidatus Nitrosopumilus limneticus]
MISEYISKLEKKVDLTYDQMSEIMTEVLSGKTNDDQNMNILSNLSKKGETDDELLGMLDKMQELSL